MRAWAGITKDEKERIYSLARAGVTDDALCKKFDVDEAMLLRIYDEVLCDLQRRRGYKGLYTSKEFFRNCEVE